MLIATEPATLRPRVEEFYLSHWMRTLAQPRTKIKNLAGGLLVPWEVIDSRQLIAQRYLYPFHSCKYQV